MRIAIVGASGFVGSRLSEFFSENEIVPIGRRETASKKLLQESLEDCDVIINLAGAPIVTRWNEQYKKTLYYSRIDTTEKIVECIEDMDKKPLFISTSAVGRYRGGEVYSEYDEAYADNYLGKITKDWEDRALSADKVTRVVVFRFGVVLGAGGGMLQKTLTPFKLGVGGVIGDGSQGFSWVHIDDIKNAMKFAIENKELKGIYNLTSPNPSTNSEFTKKLGEVLNRPTILPLPAFVVKMIFGEGSTVLLDGQKVVPKRLLESGFEFKYSDLKEALKASV
ncbi:MAG: TIGR01777 family oxidoreductase [Campylobacterales bacterium]